MKHFGHLQVLENFLMGYPCSRLVFALEWRIHRDQVLRAEQGASQTQAATEFELYLDWVIDR